MEIHFNSIYTILYRKTHLIISFDTLFDALWSYLSPLSCLSHSHFPKLLFPALPPLSWFFSFSVTFSELCFAICYCINLSSVQVLYVLVFCFQLWRRISSQAQVHPCKQLFDDLNHKPVGERGNHVPLRCS